MKPRPRRATIEAIHDDSDLTAIFKPAGITSVSERWDPDAPTAIDLLWEWWRLEDADAPRPHVVHRIDKGTSGILLFARHRSAQAELRRQFRERTVEKRYLALTVGVPQPIEGTIEIAVEPDPSRPGRVRTVGRGGKACRTDYRVLEIYRDHAWVELHPHTGRTHQIRISLREVGAPCVADPFYGDGEPLLLSQFKRDYRGGRGAAERPLLGRLGLHAAAICFQHPRTGESTSIEAPLPKDLQASLRQLEKWGR